MRVPIRVCFQGNSGHRISSASCPFVTGGLNRSPQHFILEGKDGVWDGTEISSRFYCGREDGVMGSLEAWGVAEGDRTSCCAAGVVDLLPSRHRRSIFWWLRMVGFVLRSGVAPGWHGRLRNAR